jgi:hypothetical protein
MNVTQYTDWWINFSQFYIGAESASCSSSTHLFSPSMAIIEDMKLISDPPYSRGTSIPINFAEQKEKNVSVKALNLWLGLLRVQIKIL